MTTSHSFALFAAVRERLGQALASRLSQALLELAAALETDAAAAPTVAVRRERLAVAALLRNEQPLRTQRAVARLFDLSFKLLEINQARPEQAVPALDAFEPPEAAAQALAREMAAALEAWLAVERPAWLQRVDGLTGVPSPHGCAPLGAPTVVLSVLESLRSLTVQPAVWALLQAWIGPRWVSWCGAAIAEADTWLAAHTTPTAAATLVGATESGGVDVGPVVPERALREQGVMAQGVEVTRAAGAAAEAPGEAQGAATVRLDGAALALTGPVGIARGPEAAGVMGRAIEGGSALDAAPLGTVGQGPATLEQGLPDQGVAAQSSEVTGAAGSATQGATQVWGEGVEAAHALMEHARIAQGLGPAAASVAPTHTAARLAKALPKPEAVERDAVAFAHLKGVAPYERAARQHYFAGLRARMVEQQADPGALAGLDLVAGLFDYAVDDRRMPSAAMPLLWRMQWPVTALAALDVGFLGDDRRSVRRLVESIAALAMACADDMVVGTELYRRIETVVRAVEVVAHAFQVRAAVLDEQVQREYARASQGLAQLLNRVLREQQAMEAMPGRRNRRDFSRRPSREREKEVTQRIKDRLLERFGDREWPASVREFLSGVWLRHMRSAALRDGEQSAAFQVAFQVVDDLLWSVDESSARPRRSELASRIPQLIKLLVQGVGESGAKPEEFRPFLDELFLIHLRRMQRPVHAGPDTEPDTEPGTGHEPDLVPPHEPAPLALTTASSAGSPTMEPEPSDSDAPVLHEQLPPEGPLTDTVENAEPSGLSQASQAMMAGLASELELPTVPGPGARSEPATLPMPESAAEASPPASARAETDQRLLTVLGSLDLDDFPLHPRASLVEPDVAMARLARGSWLEMTGRDGRRYEAKVAWVNPRRTVVLMVRRADGRAISLRASELRERFAAKRAVLIESR